MTFEDAKAAIVEEFRNAVHLHPPFHSAHEGWAVIKEEEYELMLQVFRKHRDTDRMRREAIQLGAMALRFLVDVCQDGLGDR